MYLNVFAIENQTLKAKSYPVPMEPKCEFQ